MGILVVIFHLATTSCYNLPELMQQHLQIQSWTLLLTIWIHTILHKNQYRAHIGWHSCSNSYRTFWTQTSFTTANIQRSIYNRLRSDQLEYDWNSYHISLFLLHAVNMVILFYTYYWRLHTSFTIRKLCSFLLNDVLTPQYGLVDHISSSLMVFASNGFRL